MGFIGDAAGAFARLPRLPDARVHAADGVWGVREDATADTETSPVVLTSSRSLRPTAGTCA
jgi:hypothetical protein